MAACCSSALPSSSCIGEGCHVGQSHPPVNRSGTSHRRARSLPSPIQSSLCPPRLQLRGLTLTRGCSPPVKHIKRSTVQKPLASWPVKQGRCPAHPGVGAFLLTGLSPSGDHRCMQLRNSPLYPILTSVCAQIIWPVWSTMKLPGDLNVLLKDKCFWAQP